MVEYFRTLIEDQGWHFSYGRRDFHNIETKDGETNYFFLDPVKSIDNLSNGLIESTDYEGRFMLLTPAKLDQTYDAQRGQDKVSGKWQAHIKPKKDLIKSIVKKDLHCHVNYEILSWSETDVINVMDLNADGVLVSFKIRDND